MLQPGYSMSASIQEASKNDVGALGFEFAPGSLYPTRRYSYKCPDQDGKGNKMAHLKHYFDCNDTHATCVQCGNKLKMQERSSCNLKKHYKAKHPGFEAGLLRAIAIGCKRGKVYSNRPKEARMKGLKTDCCPSVVGEDLHEDDVKDKGTTDTSAASVAEENGGGEASRADFLLGGPDPSPGGHPADEGSRDSNLELFFHRDSSRATCTQCGSRLKMQVRSSYNLKQHYKAKHPGLVEELLKALALDSKRGKVCSSSTKPGIRAEFDQGACLDPSIIATEFSQKIAQDLYCRLFISNLLPTTLTDSEPFSRFLAYICPEFKVPSVEELTRDIQGMVEQAKVGLRSVLAKQDFVATTADCWSSPDKRSFLGMTVTWLDRGTLQRSNAVLGIKELRQGRTGESLSEAIADLHHEFGIEKKVLKTTTDSIGLCRHGADDGTLEMMRSISVHEALSSRADPVTPSHIRCVAHSVSLLATMDTRNVPGWTSSPSPTFSKPSAKAQGVWNALKATCDMAGELKAALGFVPVTPQANRWDTVYDAFKWLSIQAADEEKLAALNQICQRQHPEPLPAVFKEDIEVWADYAKVTAPLAACLNKLQAEDKAYMGCLLPTLRKLKDTLVQLSKDKSIKHAKNLVAYLLDQKTSTKEGPRGFEKRFGHLFKDMDLLMATAFHPHYKPTVVFYLCQDNETLHKVNNRIITEMVEKVNELQLVPHVKEEEVDLNGEDTDYMWPCAQAKLQMNLVERIGEGLSKWSMIRVTTSERLDSDHFPAEFREAWVALFIKYNTPLPSSAQVQGAFSSCWSDILKTRAGSLGPEDLAFLKGNLGLVDNGC